MRHAYYDVVEAVRSGEGESTTSQAARQAGEHAASRRIAVSFPVPDDNIIAIVRLAPAQVPCPGEACLEIQAFEEAAASSMAVTAGGMPVRPPAPQ